jgi:hypothetical protein
MYKFTVVIRLRESLNLSTVYRVLMVTSVCILKCDPRYTGRSRVSPVSEFFRVLSSISEDRHLSSFLAKDVPL